MDVQIIKRTTVVPIVECQCCMSEEAGITCSNENCSYTMCVTCLGRMRLSLEMDGSKCPACRTGNTFGEFPMKLSGWPWGSRNKDVVQCASWYCGVLVVTVVVWGFHVEAAMYVVEGAVFILFLTLMYQFVRSCRRSAHKVGILVVD